MHDIYELPHGNRIYLQQRIYGGGGMRSCNRPLPRNVRKHFLTRYTVKNGISNLYILLKSALKMQEMPFQRPKFQKKIPGGHDPGPLQLCRHYGLPLTKILAMPLSTFDPVDLIGPSSSFSISLTRGRLSIFCKRAMCCSAGCTPSTILNCKHIVTGPCCSHGTLGNGVLS